MILISQSLVRLVTDFRSLNSMVSLDPFPLPNISETLDRLGKNRYLSLVYLASGFHQVPIEPAGREKTGFSRDFLTFHR